MSKDILYNVYYSDFWGGASEFGLTKKQLMIVVNAYLNGDSKYTIAGHTNGMRSVNTFQVFAMGKNLDYIDFKKYCLEDGLYRGGGGLGRNHFKPEAFSIIGENVTEEFVGDHSYGSLKQESLIIDSIYVEESRIEELKKISSDQFDFSRLIRISEELNVNFGIGNYLSTGMLLRGLLDHVPPIFSQTNFSQVANNYGGGGRSFSKLMKNLQNSFRNIADSLLHTNIRAKESLPTKTQVDYRSELDVLLAEIIRVNK